MIEDLRYAVRMLLKHPGFTLVSALSLAIGIGATTTVFGVINAVMLRPLPVRDAGSLVGVEKPHPGGNNEMHTISYPEYLDYREGAGGAFAELAAWTEAPVNVELQGQPERMSAMLVSDNYFTMLGVSPALGRLLQAEAGAARTVAVVGHETWRRHYGADSSMIGRTVTLNGLPFTVIGIAPRGFTSTFGPFAPAFYAPLAIQAELLNNPQSMTHRGHDNLKLVGRLRPGVSRARGQEVLSGLDRRLEETEGVEARRIGLGVEVAPVGVLPGGMRVAALGGAALLLAIVGSVLLIACANVAGMLMARATARRREVAVRLAMGATRRRLIRQLLTESVLLFLAAAALGTALTAVLTRALRMIPIPSSLPIAVQPGIDWRVLGFTLALALATGIGFGLAPALEAVRVDLHTALKAVPAAGGGRRSRLRGAFVVTQIALSLVLLIGAGLFARALSYGETVYPGREPETVLTSTFDPEPLGYTVPRARELYRRLGERVTEMPGVEGVSFIRFLPIGAGWTNTSVIIEDASELGDQRVEVATVTPGYFATLGLRLLEGRDFRASDRDSAPPVVIINEAMAQRYWPGRSAVGRRIQLSEERFAEIIGVAENGRHRIAGEAAPPFVYGPYAQSRSDNVAMTMLVRFRGERSGLLERIRAETRTLDARLPVQWPVTMVEAVAAATLPWRVAGTLAKVFGGIGLALAAMGIYGLVAYTVSQRTRELGVRIALGADARAISGIVLGQGAKLALAGVLIGLALAFAATRGLSALLFGISAADPLVYLVVAATLWLVALAASWFPARRAVRTDPLVALRHE